MIDPQRYAPFEAFDGPDMMPDAEGYWIQLPDYLALRSKFDALVGAIKALPRKGPLTACYGQFAGMETDQYGDWLYADDVYAAIDNAEREE